jgi:hypothetical protein
MATSFRLAAQLVVLGFTMTASACSGSTATFSSLGDGGDAGNGANGGGGSGGGSSGGSGGTSSGTTSGSSGGGSGSSSGGGDVTVDQACADLASSLCGKIRTCAPFLVSLVWGDEAGCVAREKLACPALFNAPGTGITPGDAEACVPVYMAASCEDVVANKTPTACSFHGSVPAGGACGVNEQCSDGAYCDVSGGQGCGTCSARATEGGSCTDDGNCQRGLVCAKPNNSGAGTCTVPRGLGATCDKSHPCLATLGCTSGGMCGPVLGAGSSCTTQVCDSLRGLYCNPATHICSQVQLAAPGNACGFSATDGSYAACAASGRCALASGSTTNGTCEATAADGQACDATRGPPCRPPAFCAAGTCTLPSANCH